MRRRDFAELRCQHDATHVMSGILERHPAYEEVVAARFVPLWTS